MQPHDLIGRYRVIEPLGHGGMGEVWIARPEAGGERVVLKCLRAFGLPPDRSSVIRQRFVREAKITQRLVHEHIVRALEHFEQDGEVYLVLEWVDGTTMKQWLAGAPPLGERLELLRQVTSAVVHAHAQGIIHRDLKPLNVLVEPGPKAKVIDFGLARALDSTQLTRTGVVIGTIAYMAPEQGLGRDVDARADVFSLGMMIASVLDVQAPLQGATHTEIYRRLVSDEPIPLDDWLPDDLRRLLESLLAKDRDRRPDAVAVLAAIERLIAEGAGLEARLLAAREDTGRKIAPRLGELARPEPEAPLDELRSRAASGLGGALFLVGPGGSGRSRALERCLQRLRGGGYAAQSAALVPGDRGHTVLWSLLRHIEARGGSTGREKAASGGLETKASAGAAVATGGTADDLETSAEDDGNLLFQRTLQAVRRRAVEGRFALGIDDLQHAGPPEAALVDGVVALAAETPLVVILAGDAARESAGASAEAYGALLLRLAALAHVRRIEITPLRAEEVVRSMAERGVPAEVAAEAYRLAGGRPALINELLRLWHQGVPLAPIMSPAPSGLAGPLAERLGRMHESARKILEALVELGGEAPLDEVLKAAGVPRLPAQSRIRELASSHGWVAVEGDRIRLTNPFLGAVLAPRKS